MQNNDLIIQKIALGCARFKTGDERKKYERLLEASLKIGISHYDTAPSYGLGASEEILGDVMQGVDGVSIATKYGISSAFKPQTLSTARKIFKPIVQYSKPLKNLALKALKKSEKKAVYNFESMNKSFESSLKNLKRDFIDIYFLHQPGSNCDYDFVESYFNILIKNGVIKRYGLGINDEYTKQRKIGSVLQCRIDRNLYDLNSSAADFYHGVFRYHNVIYPGLFKEFSKEIDQVVQKLNWDLSDRYKLGIVCLSLMCINVKDAKFILSFNSEEHLIDTVELSSQFLNEFNSL